MLVANSSGVVAGQFPIPANVPAGTKSVMFTGSGGSRGEGIFIGQGVSVIETQQLVTTTHTWNFEQNVPAVDPLAQTFTADANRQVSSVDLWFVARGATPVEAQIREVQNGVPTSRVLGRATLPAAACQIDGSATRFHFELPTLLTGGVQYALVVLCNDAAAEIAIAELGKWDAVAGHWVTSQPYQVGVLLSSSDASTWTPHQDKDMAFRLNGAYFGATTKTVLLGVKAVVNATDLLIKAAVFRPNINTKIDFSIALPDGSTILAAADQPISLPAPITGTVTVSAILSGDNNLSPMLFKDIQIIVGTLAATGEYVTPGIPAGAGVTVKVILEALLPGASSLTVQAKGIDVADAWTGLTPYSSAAVGDGWHEQEFHSDPMTETMIHARLILAGATGARPRVRNLRVLVL